MAKIKKIKKVTLKGQFKSLNTNEKAVLFEMVKKHGLNYTTCFYRFSRDGFKPWEYEGIINIIHEFMPNFDGSIEYFWNTIPLKKTFFEYMAGKGMSRATVNTRFSKMNFKEYELIGIKKIWEDFNYERTI